MRRITVYLPEHLYSRLKIMKMRQEIPSVSGFIRSVVSLYLSVKPSKQETTTVITEKITYIRKIKKVESKEDLIKKELLKELKEKLKQRAATSQSS